MSDPRSAPTKYPVCTNAADGTPGLGCPNCHQKNSKIVFCPYCGSGMCANCSPNVRLESDGFAYTCPKCGEEVHIKKRKAEPPSFAG